MTTQVKTRPSVRKAQEQSSREHNATVAANLLSRIDGAGRLQDLVSFGDTVSRMLEAKGATLVAVCQRIYSEMDSVDPSWKLSDSKRSPRSVDGIQEKAATGAKLGVIARCWPRVLTMSVGWRAVNRMAVLAKLPQDKKHELDYQLPTQLVDLPDSNAVTKWIAEVLQKWSEGRLQRDAIGVLVAEKTGKSKPAKSEEERLAALARKEVQDGANRVKKALKGKTAAARIEAMRSVLAQSLDKPQEALDLAVAALIEQFTAEAVQASLTRLSKKKRKAA